MSENHEQPSAPSLEALENIRIWSRCTFLSLILAFGMTNFPGWGNALALPLFALTIGLAITTMVKMLKAKFPFFSVLLMVMIVVWSLFLSLSSGVQLLFPETAGNYATCLEQALTIARSNQCTEQMSDGIFSQIMGGN